VCVSLLWCAIYMWWLVPRHALIQLDRPLLLTTRLAREREEWRGGRRWCTMLNPATTMRGKVCSFITALVLIHA
jgi:hypothetical protein